MSKTTMFAYELPRSFKVATTFGSAGVAYATAFPSRNRISVHLLGHTVYLMPYQRVTVLA